MAEKADQQAQEAWKKGAMGSLADRGAKARGRGGVCRGDAARAVGTGETGVGKSEEKKQRQSIELRYEWVYLVLGVDVMRGRLW
jgi:hypothetical protein